MFLQYDIMTIGALVVTALVWWFVVGPMANQLLGHGGEDAPFIFRWGIKKWVSGFMIAWVLGIFMGRLSVIMGA